MRNYILYFCLSLALNCHSQVVINEFMQSNIDCIMDDINEYPDSWVELYNSGSTSVNLNQYKIGLTDSPSEAYQLPSQTISPKSYVLIYCDKDGKNLHTDFRLDSGKGGAIYLMDKSGNVIDKVTGIAKQPAPNISYGRKTDGSTTFGYQCSPTPGKANCGKTAKQVLGEPVFSVPGRVYDSSTRVVVKLSFPEGTPENATIRYTTDGSEPTETSTLYTKGMTLMSTTTVIRAKIFCDGYLSRPSTTHSYIYHPRNITLPVISLVTDKKNLEDTKIGILVNGPDSENKNYKHDWRRPFNFEYFEEAKKESALNQLCEGRVSGGASRDAKLKSLALYANKRFGEKRFNYEFFPEDKPGLTNFKSIVLRNAGNDFDYLYMRDAIIQRSMARHADIDWQGYRPAIIYINGTYVGMLNIRERSNEDNVFSNYDELEDVDVLENWWDLKEGTWDNFNAFKAFYEEHGHTWDEYSKLLDLDEFINYNIMNFFYNNQDFPSNNLVLWRPRAEGGRWRFIAKDTDFGLGLYNHPFDYKFLDWFYWNEYDSDRAWGNTYEATRLFRRLMEDSDFKREFIDRFAIYMNDFLNYDRVWNDIWQPMYEVIKYEYPYHRELFNRWWPNYTEELTNAQNWLKKRPDFFFRHLAEYYELGSPAELKVNDRISDTDKEKVTISINGVPLSQPIINGKFFPNRAITIKATPKEGNVVTGLEIFKASTSQMPVTETRKGDTYTTTMPTSILQVNVKLADATAIEAITPDKESSHAIYDILGRRHDTLQKGINILRKADGTTMKIRY